MARLSLFITILFLCVASIAAFDSPGITEPYRYATVSSLVPGRISKIYKKEGSYVKKGEIILELLNEEEKLKVQLAKLAWESKAEVKAAENKKNTAELDLNATKELFDSSQSVSKEELWKRELDFNLAAAELERLKTFEEKEKLEYSLAQSILNKRVIRAPYNCTIVKLFRKSWESCEAQEPLVRIVDIRKCRFITYIEASSTVTLKKGSTVNLLIGGTKTPIARVGKIEYISPEVDPASGLRRIKVLFNNSDGAIQPGVNGTMAVGD